jgi:hypothetical protein
MAPSKQYDEGGQLQLMEADRVEEEEECFESIDKRTFAASLPPLPSNPHPESRLRCCIYLPVRARACVARLWLCGCWTCAPVSSAATFARLDRDFVLFRGESDAGLASVRASFCCAQRVVVLR